MSRPSRPRVIRSTARCECCGAALCDQCGEPLAVQPTGRHKGHPPTHAPENRDAAMAGLYQSGMTIREVGARFGVTDRPVLRALDRAGVVRRPRGTRPRMLEDVI